MRSGAVSSSQDAYSPKLAERSVLGNPSCRQRVPPRAIDEGTTPLEQFLSSIHAAFPDLHVNVEDMVAEGDKVAARVRVSSTHQGEFLDIAPTDKQVTLTGIDILRIAEGKVVEHWGNFDDLGLLRQLGAIPESVEPPS